MTSALHSAMGHFIDEGYVVVFSAYSRGPLNRPCSVYWHWRRRFVNDTVRRTILYHAFQVVCKRMLDALSWPFLRFLESM